MPYGTSEACRCAVCGEGFPHAKKLSEHVKQVHGLSPVDYVVQHTLGGLRPKCSVCGAETRFKSIRYGFATNCSDHARAAMSQGGKAGGQHPAWNQGLTKRTDRRLAALSEKLKGGNNGLPDRPHPEKTRATGVQGKSELVDFVRTLVADAEIPSGQAIPPHEVDVWVPSRRVAIEYRDLVTDDSTLDKKRSRVRLLAAEAQGIRLIQFFSDEWGSKRAVCESIIAHALGATATNLSARECSVKEIGSKESAAFIDANHVSGACRAKVHLGLFHPVHGLVSVASLRVPIQKKHGKVIELARMCSRAGFAVRGGASKLLKRVIGWSKTAGFEGLLSYAELRYGTGNVYRACGLELVGCSTTNYWYTDGKVRYDRFRFRAQDGMTEKDYAIKHGVRAVWGCGNNIYLVKWDTLNIVKQSEDQVGKTATIAVGSHC